MTREKVSVHGGRNASAAHNSRHFFETKGVDAPNIDLDRILENTMYTFDDYGAPIKQAVFNDLEYLHKRKYAELFGVWNDRQNEKNVKAGHKERVRSIDKLYSMKRYRYHEDILQIGNLEDGIADPDGEHLEGITLDLIKQYKHDYGVNFQPLSMSCHRDEATFHIHFDWIFAEKLDDGTLKPAQEKGMAQAGIGLPAPDQPKGRHNNRLMTFSARLRADIIEKAKELGHDIDDVPRPKEEQKHLSIAKYAAKKMQEDREKIEELDEEIKERKEELARTPNVQQNKKQNKSLKRKNEAYKSHIERLYDFLQQRHLLDIVAHTIGTFGSLTKKLAPEKTEEIRTIEERIR